MSDEGDGADRQDRRSDRSALVVVFALSTVLFGIAMLFLLPLVLVQVRMGPAGLAIAALTGLVFGAAMTAYVSGIWRSVGGRTAARELQSAMRSEQLPPGADHDLWTARLASQERRDASTRRTAIVFAILAPFYVVLALTGNSSLWLGGIFFAVIAAVGWIGAARNAPKIAKLREQLD